MGRVIAGISPRNRGGAYLVQPRVDFKRASVELCRYDARVIESAPFLTGQFLLALPGIGDPRFEHAVIAICAHDANGAIGIGLGATIAGLGLHDLLAQFSIDPGVAPDAPVHFGGPVEPRRGFVIHSNDWGGQDTINVAGRWSLSGTIDVLRAITEGTGPSCWLVALGYAGWGEQVGTSRAALKELEKRRLEQNRLRQQQAASCGCANNCNVHGHQHASAWGSKLPTSDLKSFWGALGCACWAV